MGVDRINQSCAGDGGQLFTPSQKCTAKLQIEFATSRARGENVSGIKNSHESYL